MTQTPLDRFNRGWDPEEAILPASLLTARREAGMNRPIESGRGCMHADGLTPPDGIPIEDFKDTDNDSESGEDDTPDDGVTPEEDNEPEEEARGDPRAFKIPLPDSPDVAPDQTFVRSQRRMEQGLFGGFLILLGIIIFVGCGTAVVASTEDSFFTRFSSRLMDSSSRVVDSSIERVDNFAFSTMVRLQTAAIIVRSMRLRSLSSPPTSMSTVTMGPAAVPDETLAAVGPPPTEDSNASRASSGRTAPAIMESTTSDYCLEGNRYQAVLDEPVISCTPGRRARTMSHEGRIIQLTGVVGHQDGSCRLEEGRYACRQVPAACLELTMGLEPGDHIKPGVGGYNQDCPPMRRLQ